MNSKLYYLQAASEWNEALPLGNGTLGCMFYGGVEKEVLQLNHESIWAGPPVPENRSGANKYIKKAVKMLKKGKYLESQKLIQERVMDDRISPRSYQPLGNLLVSLKSMEGFSNYKRELDLSKAIGTITWVKDGIDYTRETFIPVKEQCVISRTVSSLPGSLSGEIEFEREGDVEIVASSYNKISILGQAEHSGTHKGVKFKSIVSIEVNGGSCVKDEDKIIIKNANSFIIVITCNTDYNFKDPSSPKITYDAENVEVLNQYNSIKDQHIINHRELYNRMSLNLGSIQDYDLEPTDLRLTNYKKNRSLSFLSLYFNFARYLTISSSRENTLCSNLQGIWCKDMEAPWNSDYHLNVNIQMIYWLCEAVGLPECHNPFFDYVEALVPNGRETAKNVYNCRGSVSHHCSDVWLFTAPFGEVEYGMWPLASGWNSRHFMEHYDYTGDRDFLLKRALPYLREASLFFLDYLTDDKNGELIFGPASSPENMFYDPKTSEICNITLGSTMAQQIVWETFYNYLRALKILNKDEEYKIQIKEAFNNLKESVIGSDGRIMEWDKEFTEVDPGHRHISHVYGVYPGFQFQNNQKYLDAAKVTLNKRLESGGGHTGWSRAWIINLWARLKCGDKVWENMNALIENSTLTNLFDNHPPFQLDGNIGGASGILEMIVQSSSSAIHLLPALPNEVSRGEIKGLHVRGGFILDFRWKDCEINSLSVKSISGNKLKVILPDDLILCDMVTEKGKDYILMPAV